MGKEAKLTPKPMIRIGHRPILWHIMRYCAYYGVQPSQTSKHWFDAETFMGLMRLRGLESNAPDRYAEAFYARKLALELNERQATMGEGT